MAMTGAVATKIPANKMATSRIGRLLAKAIYRPMLVASKSSAIQRLGGRNILTLLVSGWARPSVGPQRHAGWSAIHSLIVGDRRGCELSGAHPPPIVFLHSAVLGRIAASTRNCCRAAMLLTAYATGNVTPLASAAELTAAITV